MDFSETAKGMLQNTSPSMWIFGTAIIVLVFYAVRLFVNTPLYAAQFNLLTPTTEGFQGVVFGSGDPPCLRDLDSAAKALEIVAKEHNTANDADLREFALLVGKLACLKKDLLSPSGVVLNTRHLAYETHHDRIAVGEVAGQCLNRTIPQRDLDIIFLTYRKRGLELIRNLAETMNLSEEERSEADKKFVEAWTDVYDVSKSRCLADGQNGAGEFAPHMPGAFLPPSLDFLKTYQGYY